MSKIIELAVAGFLLVVVIVAVMSFGGGNDKYVQMVKGGTLDGYPQKTVGEAFDDFLDNPKWESGLSEDGERFVNVKGGILYFDKEWELAVQFIVDERNEAFQYNACEIDGAPQNNLVFWNLLEIIYNDDSALPASSSQNNSNPVSDKIVIGDTQSYDNEYGNMEVTLDYVEFTDRIENPLGGYNLPDEGSIFLRAVFTLKNIGTEKGSLITAWSTVVYDGMYEYRNSFIEGETGDINPLTSPTTGALVFMVPNDIVESDKSLVININDGSGQAVISYVIRPDANMSGENGTSYAVEFPLTVSSDAMNVFAEWAANHPLVGNYHLDLISDNDVDNGGNEIFLFTYEGNGGMFNMSIRKSDGYMEYISKFDTMSMDEWYESYFGEDDMEAGSTNTGSINSMEDAQKLVEDWMIDHPIGAEATVDPGAPANDIESVRAEYYVFVLWSTPENALGFVYVRKSDGYMAFQGLDSEELIDLDEWYYAQL